MLKKFFVLILLSTFLSGCCSKSVIKEEISFVSWGSVTEVSILKKIISDFEQEYPNIKVNFIHVPQNYFQKLHLLFASNTAPDVVFINNLYLPLYESKLECLNEKIRVEGFYPQSIEGLSLNGKLLAIPRDISSQIFYVNLDIVNLPDKSWTLQTLLTLTQSKTNKDHFGISFENDAYWVKPYLSYFGEEIGEDYLSQEGISFYKNLRDKYKVAPTNAQIGSSTAAQMFLDGKIAFYLSGRWMYPKIKEKATFDWAVINFPLGKNSLPCDVSGWAISKNSKHKESALKFIEFLSNEKSAEYFAATGLVVPARVVPSQILYQNYRNEKVFIDIIKDSKPSKTTKNYKKLTDKISEYLSN